MSDTYQAIYDAVRSRIGGVNISETVREVLWRHFDISRSIATLTQDFTIVALEAQRPSVLFRPKLTKDGTHWCALYGENLIEGFAAFGETPEKAMREFDVQWSKP